MWSFYASSSPQQFVADTFRKVVLFSNWVSSVMSSWRNQSWGVSSGANSGWSGHSGRTSDKGGGKAQHFQKGAADWKGAKGSAGRTPQGVKYGDWHVVATCVDDGIRKPLPRGAYEVDWARKLGTMEQDKMRPSKVRKPSLVACHNLSSGPKIKDFRPWTEAEWNDLDTQAREDYVLALRPSQKWPHCRGADHIPVEEVMEMRAFALRNSALYWGTDLWNATLGRSGGDALSDLGKNHLADSPHAPLLAFFTTELAETIVLQTEGEDLLSVIDSYGKYGDSMADRGNASKMQRKTKGNIPRTHLRQCRN